MSNARVRGGVCGMAKLASWLALVQRFLHHWKTLGSSSLMKNRNPATSKKRRRGITRATSQLSARNQRTLSRCSARRHLRSKVIIMHGNGSTNCLRLRRVSPRARCHPLRSSACAMNFNRRTKPVPSHRRCMWESSNALATERRR